MKYSIIVLGASNNINHNFIIDDRHIFWYHSNISRSTYNLIKKVNIVKILTYFNKIDSCMLLEFNALKNLYAKTIIV